MDRRVAGLSRQQDVTVESLRNLSATAFKRADEHASAIQRLTLVSHYSTQPDPNPIYFMDFTSRLKLFSNFL